MHTETLEPRLSLSKDPTPDWTQKGMKWEEADSVGSDNAHLQRK